VALGWASGIVPAVVTLTIWKARGLGTLPLFSSYAPVHEATGTTIAITTNRYISLNWHHLSVEWSELGEVFWDLRFLQFVLVAGALGAMRRNLRAGLFVTAWFVAFCIVKGMSNQADISTTSYFRLTLPGIAALALLVPAIGFLWPGTRRAPAEIAPESWSFDVRSPLAVAAVALALVPLVVVIAAQPAGSSRSARLVPASTEAPISASLTPTVNVNSGTVTVTWQPTSHAGSTKVAYAVFRTSGNDGCTLPPAGARECDLSAPVLASTEKTSITDRPGHGHFWYRVAAVADYKAMTSSTDLMLLGPAVSVRL